MAYIRITKQFTFEMAHALIKYDGLCKNIHGHSYHFDVTIKGNPSQDTSSSKQGMLMDFGDLKLIINEEIIARYDHTLLLNENVNKELLSVLKKNYDKIVTVPFQPTTENMLIDFASKIQRKLPPEIQLYSLKLRETNSSFAEWYAEDNC